MIHHKHLLVRAHINNLINDTEKISNWISNLVESIQMKILHGPVSIYCNKVGNKGITGFAIIETSHIVLHTWDEDTPAILQLDVYTCSELDVDLVFKALAVFQPTTLDYKFLDRENGFTEILESPEQVVDKWVSRISEKNPNLGGQRICPFAKVPEIVSVKNKLTIENFINFSDQVTVYMEDGIYSSYDNLERLCRELKNIHPKFTFLPDHPHRKNFIKGQETGNGVFPCIIVQNTEELKSARKSLEKTDYYSYWDNDYLAEIRSFD